MTLKVSQHSRSNNYLTTPLLMSVCLACIPSVNANNDNNTIHQGILQQTQVFLIKVVNGKEQLIAINKVDKDDLQANTVFEYQTRLTNKSSERVRSMNVTLSVPKSVILIGHTTPEYVTAMTDIDDSDTFHEVPIMAKVNGVEQAVPLSHYRSLRWQIADLGAECTKKVSYRVILKATKPKVQEQG